MCDLLAYRHSACQNMSIQCISKQSRSADRLEQLGLNTISETDAPPSASAQRHGTVDVLVNNAGKAAWSGQGPTDGAPEQ